MRNLLKALLTTGAATIVVQIFGLLSAKILAVSLGASGVGFYSLLRQTHDTAAAIGGISAGGLVQGLAARTGAARTRLWWAAIALMVLGAGVTAVALLVASRPLAELLFDRSDEVATMAVMFCAFTVVLGISFTTLSAGANAARAIGAMAAIYVGGAALTALVAWPVARLSVEHQPLLVLLIGLPLLAQLIAVVFVLHRIGWLPGRPSAPEFKPAKPEFSYFAGFIGMNVVLTVVSGLSLLFIRSGVVHAEGLATAGHFSAGWGLGMQSISLLLSAFGVYILPTLAAAEAQERRNLLQDAATLILGLSLPLLAALIAWKPLVIRILLSDEFLPSVTLLQWLLLGNWLKLLSWVFATPFLAAADLRRYLAMELAWYLLLVGGCLLAFALGMPMTGIGISFFCAYLAYFALTAVMVHHRYGFALSQRNLVSFMAGLALLAAISVLTWNAWTIDWPIAIAAPIAAAIISYLTLTPHHRRRGWAMLRSLRQP